MLALFAVGVPSEGDEMERGPVFGAVAPALPVNRISLAAAGLVALAFILPAARAAHLESPHAAFVPGASAEAPLIEMPATAPIAAFMIVPSGEALPPATANEAVTPAAVEEPLAPANTNEASRARGAARPAGEAHAASLTAAGGDWNREATLELLRGGRQAADRCSASCGESGQPEGRMAPGNAGTTTLADAPRGVTRRSLIAR